MNSSHPRSNPYFTLNDIAVDERLADDIFATLTCGEVELHLVSTNDPRVTDDGPTIYELDVVNYLAVFRMDFVETVSRYIESALDGSVIEQESGMRILGALSQQAVRAYIQHCRMN